MTLRYHYFNHIIIHEKILFQGSNYYHLLLSAKSTFLGQIPKGSFSSGTFTNLHFALLIMDWSPLFQVLLPLPTSPIGTRDRFILSVCEWDPVASVGKVVEWAVEGWCGIRSRNNTSWISYVLKLNCLCSIPTLTSYKLCDLRQDIWLHHASVASHVKWG